MARAEQVRARIKAADAEIDAFIARLSRFLSVEVRRVLSELKGGGSANAIDTARILIRLVPALKEAGLDREIRYLEKIYVDQLSEIRQRFEVLAPGQQIFTHVDRQLVESLIEVDTDIVTTVATGYVDDAKAALMRSVLAGQPLDFGAFETARRDGMEATLRTEARTLLTGFSRAVTAKKADDLGLELFMYIGPEDDLTREFCAGVLSDRDPPIYRVDEIEAMDNEQGLPVLAYGGGYNCRHEWVPLTMEQAQELGYDD